MATPSMTKLYRRKTTTPSIHSLLGTGVYGESQLQIYPNCRSWFEFIRNTPSWVPLFQDKTKGGSKGTGEDVPYLRLQQRVLCGVMR